MGVHESRSKTSLVYLLSSLTKPGTTPAMAATVSNKMPLRLALVPTSVGEKSGITYHI